MEENGKGNHEEKKGRRIRGEGNERRERRDVKRGRKTLTGRGNEKMEEEEKEDHEGKERKKKERRGNNNEEIRQKEKSREKGKD